MHQILQESPSVDVDRVNDLPGTTVWEGGHFYQAKGPTVWSAVGWAILDSLAHPRDGRLLFIDDVHPLHLVNELERKEETIEFNPHPAPTHSVTESSVRTEALQSLEVLKDLPKRKRARQRAGTEQWHCGSSQLTNNEGKPLCLLLDLGLTVRKQRLGYLRAVNIVPAFYESEQRALRRLAAKVIPEFRQEVILYDREGRWWYLPSD